MAEDYKQFDTSGKPDKVPIIPEIVKHVTSLKYTEIILTVLLCIISLVCIVFVILYTNEKPTVVVEEKVCVSAPCLKSASYLVGNMNQSIDPCKNFYQYACGGFRANHPLDAEDYRISVYSNILEENKEKLKKILESPVINSSPDSAERKLKDVFASCTNTYLKERAKGYPLLNKVIPNTGGWYVLGTFNKTTWNMQSIMEKVHVDFWTNALFTFRVSIDQKDRKKSVIQMDMSGMSMYWYYYVHQQTTKYGEDLKKFMRRVGTLLVRDSNMTIENATEKIETFVNDAFGVEYQLANITLWTAPSPNPHEYGNRMTIRDLTSNTGNVIDFTSFLTYMFRDAGVTPDTKVVVLEADWFRLMTSMVKNLGPDKDRILNNYFTWRMAFRYAQEMSWEYVHANREFYVDRYGIPQFLGTWRYCFRRMDQDLRDALSSMYVKNHFADKNKDKVHEILGYVKQTLIDNILRNVFMDGKTKDLAKEKIQTSLDQMGYPDYMMNDDLVASIYQSLTVDRNNYFDNILSINKFLAKDWNNRLRNGKEDSRWFFPTYSTLMYYYGPWHELLVPAGLLQFPIYDYSLPHYTNFGSMGSRLAHFLIHAIDNYGSRYDKNGDYNILSWWTNKTKASYNSTSTCMANYFSNQTMGPYAIPGEFQLQTVKVKGKQYASEGLAIASGIKIAFQAYQKWEAANGVEKIAPGLGLTNEQMLFVSYAQTRCFNMNDREAYDSAVRGTVSSDVTINGAMAHLKEFSQAFNCPVNSPMNPAKKCNTY